MTQPQAEPSWARTADSLQMGSRTPQACPHSHALIFRLT